MAAAAAAAAGVGERVDRDRTANKKREEETMETVAGDADSSFIFNFLGVIFF